MGLDKVDTSGPLVLMSAFLEDVYYIVSDLLSVMKAYI